MTEPRPRSEAELIEFVRSSDVAAPEALHRRIEQLVAERSRGRRPILGGAFGARATPLARRLGAATALAGVLVAVLAIVIGGSGHSLSVQQATALTLSPARAPAPEESSNNHGALAASVQGVSFPYWERLGWRSVGQRADSVAGHAVMTVFYANRRGQRIGYAIVGGTAPAVSGGMVQRLNGTPYRMLAGEGAKTVVWLRNGRLCVLSGRGVDAATLLYLASSGPRVSAA
ncbi:MAG TPA: hypothetical protein VGW98_04585 [Solirubrobacteraceae bacterium]|jgi:hypothetical protein|nr:hypothetical protein [Solirubrobacteraceae bacterium]